MGIFEIIMRNCNDVRLHGPAFPLRHISGLLGYKYYVTNFRGAGTVHLRPRSSDRRVFDQVFLQKQYDFSMSGQFPNIWAAYQKILSAGQTPIIIDAGANVGAASMWFSKQFPLAHILAIEPDSDNIEMCRLNTLNVENVKIIKAAIGSQHGKVSLSNPMKEAWTIQTTRSDEGGIDVYTIPEIVLNARQPAKIFLVKIDIEGFEDDLFANNTEWVDEADVIIIEPHDWLFPGKGKSRNFQKIFGEQNFEIFISGENLVYVRQHT